MPEPGNDDISRGRADRTFLAGLRGIAGLGLRIVVREGSLSYADG